MMERGKLVQYTQRRFLEDQCLYVVIPLFFFYVEELIPGEIPV